MRWNNLPPAIFAWAVLLIVSLAGCGEQEYAPVRGKVIYKGKPLNFGSVLFQPEGGQPAYGKIENDGSFYLSTNGDGDGARIGSNKVRVACFASQEPAANGENVEEPTVGPSLIPRRYNSFEHSGLRIDVPPEGIDDLVLELKN